MAGQIEAKRSETREIQRRRKQRGAHAHKAPALFDQFPREAQTGLAHAAAAAAPPPHDRVIEGMPTDEAIAAMPPVELKALRENPKSEDTLRWLKYHFIKSEVCKKSDFGIIREIITWSSLPTFMFVTPTKMALNDVSIIVKFDLPAKNGIIHGISKALDPRSYMREDDKKK
jgi:hypothetical protein